MGKTVWKNGVLYTPNGVIRNGAIVVGEDGTIERIGETAQADEAAEVRDLQGRAVLPGLIDVHVHGGGGFNSMNGTAEDLDGMSRFHAEHGTTAFLATTETDTPEAIAAALEQVRATMERGGTTGAEMVGAHLEGPFLNVKRAGAQAKELLIPPTAELIDRFIDAAGGHIRLVTLAPEMPGGMEAVSRFAERGVVVSIGHSDATYDEVREAIARGASHTTHHFNGMRPLHHREPGVAGAGLALEELTTELILDGIHVHPAVARLLFQAKQADNLCVITDAVHVAGLPDGDYGHVVMKNGEVVLHDGSSLAGSSLTMLAALRNAVEYTGWPLERVLPSFTRVPARQAGVGDRKGALAQGKDADFIVIDGDYRLLATIVKGKEVVNKGI